MSFSRRGENGHKTTCICVHLLMKTWPWFPIWDITLRSIFLSPHERRIGTLSLVDELLSGPGSRFRTPTLSDLFSVFSHLTNMQASVSCSVPTTPLPSASMIFFSYSSHFPRQTDPRGILPQGNIGIVHQRPMFLLAFAMTKPARCQVSLFTIPQKLERGG